MEQTYSDAREAWPMSSSVPDLQLQALQEEWGPAWKIWRARRSTDPPDVYEGEFVASRMDDEAGLDRTLMRPTAAELDAALRVQRGLAGHGTAPLPTGYLG